MSPLPGGSAFFASLAHGWRGWGRERVPRTYFSPVIAAAEVGGALTRRRYPFRPSLRIRISPTINCTPAILLLISGVACCGQEPEPMAFGPSDSSANGAARFQPGANAPGKRHKNILRAEGPSYHPCRWIGPSALYSASSASLRSKEAASA